MTGSRCPVQAVPGAGCREGVFLILRKRKGPWEMGAKRPPPTRPARKVGPRKRSWGSLQLLAPGPVQLSLG